MVDERDVGTTLGGLGMNDIEKIMAAEPTNAFGGKKQNADGLWVVCSNKGDSVGCKTQKEATALIAKIKSAKTPENNNSCHYCGVPVSGDRDGFFGESVCIGCS